MKSGFLGPFLRSLPGLITLAAAGLLAMAGIVYLLGWPWWAWLMGFFILLVILAGALLTWRWRSKRQEARLAERAVAEEQRERAGDAVVDRHKLEELREKWRAGLRTLRDSRLQRRGEDPLYALPWYLVLGKGQSGKTAAIRGVHPSSSVAAESSIPQGIAGTRNCDWWFFDEVVLLDTAGRYAFPAEEADEGEWRELLSLLKRDRWREPLNGVIVAVAADALASQPEEELREKAGQLRRRMDEVGRYLGANVPVYFLVTKSDRIAGFTEFFGRLPESVLGQVMGCVNGDVQDRSRATAFYEQGFRSITQRLDGLRLTLMEEEDGPDALRPLFFFPEELRGLEGPLRTFVDTFFRQNPYRETPFFRGFFFASGRQEGSPSYRLAQALGFDDWAWSPESGKTARAFFLRDFFSVILPQDRPLAHRTARWYERYRLAQMAGLVATVALSLLLSLLLTLSFIRNRQVLSRLDVEACLGGRGPSSEVSLAQRLEELDECRERIEGLTPRSFWGKMAQGFGFRQIRRMEDPLRQRYLQVFQARALAPLDARIDQKLVAGPEAPLQVGPLLQRIHLLGRCRDRGGCPDPKEWRRPNYRVMLTAEKPGIKEDDPMVGHLLRTHEAYLRWQTDLQAFQEMRSRHLERLRRWLNSGGLRAEWIVASASLPFAPLQYRDFWGSDLAGQVDPPYTRRTWDKAIWPLLSALQEVAPEVKEVEQARREFEVSYRGTGLRQWGQFLADFPQGEELTQGRGPRRELALRLLGSESPYRGVIGAASSFLKVAVVQGSDTPAWAAMFQRYADLEARAAEAKKLAKKDPQAVKASYRDEEREAFESLSRYGEALDQLRAELGNPEKSFESAQKAFKEGEPTDSSLHPILKAAWNVRRLRRVIGFPQEEDRIFWILLVRPPERVWRVILDDAGAYLQEQWEKLRWKVKPLPPEQGWAEVVAFVNGPAAAFLEIHQGRYTPRRLVDEEVSFTGPFLSYLRRPPMPPPGPEPDDLPGGALTQPKPLELPGQIVATLP